MRFLSVKTLTRSLSSRKLPAKSNSVDLDQYMKCSDLDRIEKNVLLRKHYNNLPLIRQIIDTKQQSNNQDMHDLEAEILKLPNETHPRICGYGDEPKELDIYTPNAYCGSEAVEFSEVAKYMNIFRMDHLGNYTGHKSYYLYGKLAELEQALKQYTVNELQKNDFHLISVPDILPKTVIEGCGMQTEGERTQVYKLDSGMCLSGTSEMALAGYFANKTLLQSQLPVKVAAVSRCYRAETSGLNEEKGIYRVHQFTKVEMFSICTQQQSEEMIEFFKLLQIDIFKNLGLKFRLLDMPPMELGAPAYQKYDIEAWMPGRQMWGELSSCSNCTDYQSKRLNIKYISNDNKEMYAHTINGTAAAIPRLLISLIESNQVGKNIIKIPDVLVDYIHSNEITKEKNIPEIKLLKHLKSR